MEDSSAKHNDERRTVLIVDDEEDNVEYCSEILHDLGYHVMPFLDARSALSELRSGAPVDLVITDFRMPVMDGLQFIEAFRGFLPDMQVIMLTAHGDVDTYFKAFSLGVFDFLIKPVRKTEMERILGAVFSSRKIRRSEGRADARRQHRRTV